MFFVDEYAILNMHHIVFAGPFDPCEEPDHQGQNPYIIGLTLIVGTKRCREAIRYPTRGARDAAFETLTMQMKALMGQEVSDGDDA